MSRRYDTKSGFTRVGTCAAHSSAITHLDWSADGLYLQSNASDGELLFWEMPMCDQVRPVLAGLFVCACSGLTFCHAGQVFSCAERR